MSDQWTGRLSEYLDGELEAGERVSLESHLQSCTECAAIVEDLCRIGIQFGAEWIQSTLLLAAKKRRKDRDGP